MNNTTQTEATPVKAGRKIRWNQVRQDFKVTHCATLDDVIIEIYTTKHSFCVTITKSNGAQDWHEYCRHEWSFGDLKQYLIENKSHPVAQYN